nr:DNA polymerase III subunit gamma/tau [Saprospiraceae bacterium]
MSYQVSALKYRPQRFDEVVGQDHVTETLKRGLQSDRMAHALLFCGPRGVGKTTIARILAKALNCENPTENKEPCNNCVSCEAFNTGASFNILELDAASNNRVEDIRHLVEQVGYPPQRGRYKVFIIDEVHMLSQAAFNAFLKTLEEPPPYAVFILATTEKHKILPTILSRCQIYDFKRIPIPEIIGQLTYICEQDEIQSEKEALNLIAQKADGALRDALSLFDKLNSVTSGQLTYEKVIKSLNVLDRGHFFKFVEWFLNGNTAEILCSTDRILADGFEGHVVLEGLQEHFRELFVCKDQRTRALMQSGERFEKMYEDQAQLCTQSFLLSAMNVLSDALFQYKDASNKRMHMELTLCKLATITHFIEDTPLGGGERKNTNPPQNVRVENDSKKKVRSNMTEGTGPDDSQNRGEEGMVKEDNKEEGAYKVNLKEGGNKESETEKSHGEKGGEADLKIPSESSMANQAERKDSRPDEPILKGKSIPRLQSLGSLKNKIKEKKKNAAREKLELNEENLHKIWNEYIGKINSPSLLVSLKNVSLSVDDWKIRIGTMSEVARQTVKMERDLLELVRRSFVERQVEIDILIDEKLVQEAEENEPKLSTSKEKYDYMVGENPNLGSLIEKLNLKIVD